MPRVFNRRLEHNVNQQRTFEIEPRGFPSAGTTPNLEPWHENSLHSQVQLLGSAPRARVQGHAPPTKHANEWTW